MVVKYAKKFFNTIDSIKQYNSGHIGHQNSEEYKSNRHNTGRIRNLYLATMLLYWILMKIVSGASCKGNLFPTIYSWDFKTLITSENKKLENPNNVPVKNTTSGTAVVLNIHLWCITAKSKGMIHNLYWLWI